MDDDRQAFREQWDYRVAVRRFQSAFEAADRLAKAERTLLLKEVAERLLQNLPHVSSEEPDTPRVASIETEEGQPEAGRPDNPSDAA